MSAQNVDILVRALPMAFFAGTVAIGATMAIERWGGTLGGLLGTIPSTIVPASLGLFSQSPNVEAYTEAMDLVPAGMLLNVLFLYVWRVVPARLPSRSMASALALMTILSLSFWLCGALTLVFVGHLWSQHFPPFLLWPCGDFSHAPLRHLELSSKSTEPQRSTRGRYIHTFDTWPFGRKRDCFNHFYCCPRG